MAMYNPNQKPRGLAASAPGVVSPGVLKPKKYGLASLESSARSAGLGAAAGAGIGSIVPGIGTVVGGVIGGGLGLVADNLGGGNWSPAAAPSSAAPPPAPKYEPVAPRLGQADQRADAAYGQRQGILGSLGADYEKRRAMVNPFDPAAEQRGLAAAHAQFARQAAEGERANQQAILRGGLAGTGAAAAMQAGYQGQVAAGAFDTQQRALADVRGRAADWDMRQGEGLASMGRSIAGLAGEDIGSAYEPERQRQEIQRLGVQLRLGEEDLKQAMWLSENQGLAAVLQFLAGVAPGFARAAAGA
jgi:hypothetical protein